VKSYLRARMLPAGAIFSSESPVYVPRVWWLDEHALLALLNSSLIEFAVKTFLASRNHIEVGHVRRLPAPVLDADARTLLSSLAETACEAAERDDSDRVAAAERDIDELVRDLYGVRKSAKLVIVR
jgi:hypothetical protein